MTLELVRDLAIIKINRDDASIRFAILNPIAVENFLNDKEMMRFLTDPPIGPNPGCRLKFQRNPEGTELTISRQIGPTSILDAVCHHLLCVLKSYVLTFNQDDLGHYANWQDLSLGLAGVVDPHTIPALKNPRGDAILARDEEKEVSLFATPSSV